MAHINALIASRDQSSDDDDGTSCGDHEDLTAWQEEADDSVATERRGPPNIVFKRPGEGRHTFNSGYRVVSNLTSHHRYPPSATMATADNRPSLVPDVPERTSKRYR